MSLLPLPGEAHQRQAPHGVDPFFHCCAFPSLVDRQRIAWADKATGDVFAKGIGFHRYLIITKHGTGFYLETLNGFIHLTVQ